jgi:PHD/YefM family antitoxin component YafN of YafNO toxin-antitoxin module
MTPEVKFKTVTELSRTATAIVAEIERTGEQVIIIKRSKPVAILRRVTKNDKGRKETVSNLRNKALVIIADIEKAGKPLIITRDNEPIAYLQGIGKTTSIEK